VDNPWTGLREFASSPRWARPLIPSVLARRLGDANPRQKAIILVGKTLGHYEILEPLGKGGMGEIGRRETGSSKYKKAGGCFSE